RRTRRAQRTLPGQRILLERRTRSESRGRPEDPAGAYEKANADVSARHEPSDFPVGAAHIKGQHYKTRKRSKNVKRFLCVLALLGLAVYGLSHPTFAQDPAKVNMRADVLDTIGRFSQAANQADVNTMSTMISSKPDVSYIADGVITRGPN